MGIKILDHEISFDQIDLNKGRVKLRLIDPAPTTAFIKGQGKRELLRPDEIEVDVSVEFLVKLYLALKMADEGVEPFFEQDGDVRITVFEDEKHKPNHIGIKVVNYATAEGGVVWVNKALPRLKLMGETRRILRNFPLIPYKEAELNIVYNRQIPKIVFTFDTGEWTEAKLPEWAKELWVDIVWWFDKTGMLPQFVRFTPKPENENEEFEAVALKGDGRFIVLGREFDVNLFRKIGYLLEI